VINVTIHVAKTTLSKLIERACAGEEVIISRGDFPVARLVPIASAAPRRTFGALKGSLKVPESFFDPLPPDELEHWK
jgi:prevent-host-death family protein